ncbi:MAG: Gfo/Idh/MocA family oxidoreductase [Verrucomicrobia bacterium]|nr:Gfo/Idh/MocA family oxidoreductase [Verrucomicrobiota bacterium]
MSQKGPLTVGVLGLGRAGWNIHVAAIRDDARYKIVAVSDPVSERRDQAIAELGCEVFDAPTLLLKKATPELIINATPSQFHAPLTRQALRMGFHVVLEKPLARDAREAASVVRAAKASKRKLFAHHNYRFQPTIRHLGELIESGIIGKMFEIRVCVSQFSRRNDWQTLLANNGGLLNNHGTHYIDAIMQMIGSPIEDVWSDLKLISDAGDAEDHVRLLIRARNGCVGEFFLSTSSAITMPMWTVWGTCGTLVSNGTETTIRYFDPKKVKPQTVETGPAVERRYGSGDELPWREKTVKVKARDKSTFYDNVYGVLRKRERMVVTPESVLDFFRVIDRARGPVQNWRPRYGAIKKG